MKRNFDEKLRQLLRDFDFEVHQVGNSAAIYTAAIMRFDSPRYFGPCRDVFDAADRLISIIHDDNYYNRLQAILGANHANQNLKRTSWRF